jgi:hypothetical protein
VSSNAVPSGKLPRPSDDLMGRIFQVQAVLNMANYSLPSSRASREGTGVATASQILLGMIIASLSLSLSLSL